MFLFHSFVQLLLSCRLSWTDTVEDAPVFGHQIRARQFRTPSKSAIGADILYTAPCRRVKLNSWVANGVLHRRITLV